MRSKLAEMYSNSQYKLTSDDVILTNGGSGGIWLSIATLANAGDNFLVPAPGFPLCNTIASNLDINVKEYSLMEERDWEIDLVHM